MNYHNSNSAVVAHNLVVTNSFLCTFSLNTSEIMPGNGKLANYLGLVILWISENNHNHHFTKPV